MEASDPRREPTLTIELCRDTGAVRIRRRTALGTFERTVGDGGAAGVRRGAVAGVEPASVAAADARRWRDVSAARADGTVVREDGTVAREGEESGHESRGDVEVVGDGSDEETEAGGER